MNVLQLIGSFNQGGSERQAVQLTKLLHSENSVNVFVATLNKEGVLLKEIEALNLGEVYEYRLNSFYDVNFLKQVRKFSKFLRDQRIDIIHTHDFYTNIFGILAAKLAGVKIKIASKRQTVAKRNEMQNRVENQIFKIADGIVVNADAVKRYVISHGTSEEKVRVIHNGLDVERLIPKETDSRKICAVLGIPYDQNIKFVVHLANVRHRVKNQEMLLRSAVRIKDKCPEAHFVFAGEGERLEELETLSQELGISERTHFIGTCVNVPELLSISYVCVLTSFSEGFSNSILEYMNAGKPVVATDVGGANEAIVDGTSGFLVDSNDDEALAAKLEVLFANQEMAADFGNVGRTRIEKMFTLSAQLNKTLDLYRELGERR